MLGTKLIIQFTIKRKQNMTKGSTVLVKVDSINEALVSWYCVVFYDNKPYPGIIQDVDKDEVEVKTMHSIGRNRFFWPMLDDILWYSQSQIVTHLDKPPERVTSRHIKIEGPIWTLIESLFN